MRTTKAVLTRRIGAGYFIAMALFNLGLDFISNNFIWLDWVLLAVTCLPLLITKRIFLIAYGMLTALLSSYIGFAVLLSYGNPNYHAPAVDWIMGSLLPLTAIGASLLILYAAIYTKDEKRFSLI